MSEVINLSTKKAKKLKKESNAKDATIIQFPLEFIDNGLAKKAEELKKEYGVKGAIIILCTEDDKISLGKNELSAREVGSALCVVLHDVLKCPEDW